MAVGLAAAVGAATLGVSAPVAFGQVAPAAAGACQDNFEPKGAARFTRTELYFGSNKPDGSVVTPEQFQTFLDEEITPRFPDGLTLLTGLGQFRGSSARIERERSMLLILLYPTESSRSSSQKIEEIRTAYEKKFYQESVLRADEQRPQCVSF
jgi:hypothetical protein